MRRRGKKEFEAATSSAGFGFGLVTSSLKELFKPKRSDEDWGEFILVKAGLILMILIGLGIIGGILFFFYLESIH